MNKLVLVGKMAICKKLCTYGDLCQILLGNAGIGIAHGRGFELFLGSQPNRSGLVDNFNRRNDEGELETLALQLGRDSPLLVERENAEECWTIAKALSRHSMIFQMSVEHLVKTHFTGSECLVDVEMQNFRVAMLTACVAAVVSWRRHWIHRSQQENNMPRRFCYSRRFPTEFRSPSNPKNVRLDDEELTLLLPVTAGACLLFRGRVPY